MISPRLKVIFGLSVPLFAIHGIEEYFTGFYKADAWDMVVFGPIISMDAHRAMFATFEIMLVLLLTISFLLILGEKWRFHILAILGLIYLFELRHVIKAFLAWAYYPGVISSLFFPILAYFFWKEWFKLVKLKGIKL